MKLKFGICIESEIVEFELDTERLDRNYDDEDYAYWLVKDKYGYMHEINIYKDDKGGFLMEGKDYVWFDYDDFEGGILADVEEDIEFKTA